MSTLFIYHLIVPPKCCTAKTPKKLIGKKKKNTEDMNKIMNKIIHSFKKKYKNNEKNRNF